MDSEPADPEVAGGAREAQSIALRFGHTETDSASTTVGPAWSRRADSLARLLECGRRRCQGWPRHGGRPDQAAAGDRTRRRTRPGLCLEAVGRRSSRPSEKPSASKMPTFRWNTCCSRWPRRARPARPGACWPNRGSAGAFLAVLTTVRGNQRVTVRHTGGGLRGAGEVWPGPGGGRPRRQARPSDRSGHRDPPVVQILSRKSKNNPVLIGEPGVGKTAIVEGLAQRIVRGTSPRGCATRRSSPWTWVRWSPGRSIVGNSRSG